MAKTVWNCLKMSILNAFNMVVRRCGGKLINMYYLPAVSLRWVITNSFSTRIDQKQFLGLLCGIANRETGFLEKRFWGTGFQKNKDSGFWAAIIWYLSHDCMVCTYLLKRWCLLKQWWIQGGHPNMCPATRYKKTPTNLWRFGWWLRRLQSSTNTFLSSI